MGKYYHVTDRELMELHMCVMGQRGAGRIHAELQRQKATTLREAYDRLIVKALRIKLLYPLGCPDVDRYIARLLYDREWSSRYYFTDVFDPHAVTLRKEGDK